MHVIDYVEVIETAYSAARRLPNAVMKARQVSMQHLILLSYTVPTEYLQHAAQYLTHNV